MEEARALHREIQRRRLLTSYQEAKFRRLRRIKSKKYHRILKKEKLKATVAELDQLIENGEEGVEEKLAELDRLRALERASLKHHATGKWAKYSKLRSKYDDTARAQLNEQMALNAELMKRRSLAVLDEFGGGGKKVGGDEDEGDEDVERLVMGGGGGGGSSKKVVEETENELPLSIPTDYNPWISKVPKVVLSTNAVAAAALKVKFSNFKIALFLTPEKLFVFKPPPIPTRDEENSSERFFAKRIRARMAAQEAEERREARRQDAQDEEAILVESSAFSSSSALSTALSTTTNRAPDGDDPTTFTTTTKNLKQQTSKRGQEENAKEASDAESSEEAESSSSSSKRQKTATKNLKLDSLIVSAEEVRTKRGKLVNNVPTDGNDDDQEEGEGENDEVGGKTMGDFDFTGADMQRYLREAFLDDDVVADFLKEKKEEEGKAENPDKNSVSAYLPGWGNWAGGGIAENRRKRARLVKRTVTRERRIGAQIANAIVLKETEVDEVARRYKVRGGDALDWDSVADSNGFCLYSASLDCLQAHLGAECGGVSGRPGEAGGRQLEPAVGLSLHDRPQGAHQGGRHYSAHGARAGGDHHWRRYSAEGQTASEGEAAEEPAKGAQMSWLVGWLAGWLQFLSTLFRILYISCGLL
mgnify:CR=1 FL=1